MNAGTARDPHDPNSAGGMAAFCAFDEGGLGLRGVSAGKPFGVLIASPADIGDTPPAHNRVIRLDASLHSPLGEVAVGLVVLLAVANVVA